MIAKVNLAGHRFTRLLVQGAAANKNGKTQWNCLCDCGTLIVVQTDNLRSGHTQSCKCLQVDRARVVQTTHGHSVGRKQGIYPTGTFRSWMAMHSRCYDKNNNRYYRYGARGISVCPRWFDFENFLHDMGNRPAGKTLDRYPNTDGNYEKLNCRWATNAEQGANKGSRINL